ncbi:MAG: LysM peptidoglycan-binding domain-containing protein, partial [Muribaculaceae bacterium]|nr:LysM peptidoglycan-binding domain-containing protein [Muribaculaceae bacterium]
RQVIAGAVSPAATRSENASQAETTETTETVAPPAPKPAKTSTAKTGNGAGKPVYHTVRSGESVAKIARRYGTTTAKVLKLNNLTTSSKIHPGDRLRVK